MKKGILIQNKKIRLDFEIIETYEAGIELFGFEVKALRSKKGRLEGTHVIIRGKEAFLLNFDLPPYQSSNTPDGYQTDRTRKLLLTKKEISHLSGIERQKGLTIVPISIYNKGRMIKVEVAVARGKKKRDKRESIKKREASREIERNLKRRI